MAPVQEKLIEIPLTKYRLFLSEAEIQRLLARDPDLWATAIKRGKAILRSRQAMERMRKRRDPPPA